MWREELVTNPNPNKGGLESGPRVGTTVGKTRCCQGGRKSAFAIYKDS